MNDDFKNPPPQNGNISEGGAAIWHEAFKVEHGRPLRVLHIGNVANNAYLNSKILRKIGVESDVLCYDYYHIMACPEWEDADFSGGWGDDYAPAWFNMNLKGFNRPDWFIQGAIIDCLSYLKAKNSKDVDVAEKLKETLSIQSGLSISIKADSQKNMKDEVGTKPCECLSFSKGKPQTSTMSIVGLRNRILAAIHWQRIKNMLLGLGSPAFEDMKQSEYTDYQYIEGKCDFPYVLKRLESMYAEYYSDRIDNPLLESDVIAYSSLLKPLSDVFEYYDIIHAYSTDGIYPLLVEKPYVAYEHGTIRGIPFEKTPQGRLCALTYKAADMVAITNCDAISSVEKLKISSFEFVPHPINEEWLAEDYLTDTLRQKLRSELTSDFIVFHPSRQHWEQQRHPNWEKGNDFFIRGFARFVHEVNPNASCIMVEWGATLDESKALIDRLDIADRVLWVKPQPNREMIRYIKATEILADQFFLGAFGSTMPKALALGKPALLYLNEDVHHWCFDEMPPVCNVQTDDQIYKALEKLFENKELYNTISMDGIKWYQKYHSNSVIAERLCSLYRRALQGKKC